MNKQNTETIVTLNSLPPRLLREFKTVSKMIHIYCASHHQSDSGLCDDCTNLETYAANRLKHCPFQENKPTCGNCVIHCYKPSMKEKMIKTMRFSGPRMIFKHPLLAITHLFDSKRTSGTKKHLPDNNISRGVKKT